jgi:Carbamoyl-phosphate synthase L chain, ATP binding domain
MFRRARGDGPDIILVDTTWFPADFLAYQLASRGARVHAFTPSLRWPPYLRLAYPYLSYLEEPIRDQKSDPFAAMVERVEPACIIPCTEHAMYWLWNQPEHIQERCLPNVAAAIRPLLLDRALLLEAAADWGVATPAAMPLNSHDDCRAAIAAGLPLVVKSGQSIGGDGVALCRTSDDVMRAFDEFFRRAASVTAQRYYVGPTYLAGALFLRGEAVHFYAGEKTVMSPRLTGRAFELRSAGEPLFSALLQSAETVCKNLEWTGLASFDFVLDEGGQFRFVDFNPRSWGSVDATLTAGVDLFGGIDRWIRCGNAGPRTRSVPGITHRVFPAYALEPSDVSLWRRLRGLRDAPRGAASLVVGELAREVDQRVRRAVRVSKPAKTAKAASPPPA